jgi:hypothetical protein
LVAVRLEEGDGLTERLARDADELAEAVPAEAVPAEAVPAEDGLAESAVPECAVAGAEVGEEVGEEVGRSAGLNVATDSIAPATRHTARMLASSGMTVARPENGPASRRSRFRRRCARISRW